MRCCLSILFGFILSGQAVAQDVSDFSRVSVVPGHVLASGQYLAGVQITMAPGWKTYWRQPGEGGIPPVFDWSGSRNIAGHVVEWPVPEVFDTYGLRSLGYHGTVVFPVLFDLIDPNAETVLDLALSFGLCSDICIPAYAEASSPAPLDTVYNAGPLAAARATTTAPATGVIARCAVVPAAGAWRLDTEVAGGATTPGMVAVFETPDPDLWIGTPDAVEQGDGLLFSAPMDWFGDGAMALSRDRIRITLVESGVRAIELTGC